MSKTFYSRPKPVNMVLRHLETKNVPRGQQLQHKYVSLVDFLSSLTVRPTSSFERKRGKGKSSFHYFSKISIQSISNDSQINNYTIKKEIELFILKSILTTDRISFSSHAMHALTKGIQFIHSSELYSIVKDSR